MVDDQSRSAVRPVAVNRAAAVRHRRPVIVSREHTAAAGHLDVVAEAAVIAPARGKGVLHFRIPRQPDRRRRTPPETEEIVQHTGSARLAVFVADAAAVIGQHTAARRHKFPDRRRFRIGERTDERQDQEFDR
ncbi:hypothetical protein SDC9_110300 [bioreactor metagenome]|uniref:Uncharacterized protein n=1 Tax=bioreactor metagenome TaxID=1076179 RepID=A0A645BD75_9ZZZZ